MVKDVGGQITSSAMEDLDQGLPDQKQVPLLYAQTSSAPL